MHLKIIRAYIDGVLRFGIPAKFYLGLVVPGKGQEKKVLKDMTACLADQSMLEMYGERIDSNETDDYWPFVCINLNQPIHLHWEWTPQTSSISEFFVYFHQKHILL